MIEYTLRLIRVIWAQRIHLLDIGCVIQIYKLKIRIIFRLNIELHEMMTHIRTSSLLEHLYLRGSGLVPLPLLCRGCFGFQSAGKINVYIQQLI